MTKGARSRPEISLDFVLKEMKGKAKTDIENAKEWLDFNKGILHAVTIIEEKLQEQSGK